MEAMPLARLQEVFPAWHISRNIPGDTPSRDLPLAAAPELHPGAAFEG
jgi:hypothetical protein